MSTDGVTVGSDKYSARCHPGAGWEQGQCKASSECNWKLSSDGPTAEELKAQVTASERREAGERQFGSGLSKCCWCIEEAEEEAEGTQDAVEVSS